MLYFTSYNLSFMCDSSCLADSTKQRNRYWVIVAFPKAFPLISYATTYFQGWRIVIQIKFLNKIEWTEFEIDKRSSLITLFAYILWFLSILMHIVIFSYIKNMWEMRMVSIDLFHGVKLKLREVRWLIQLFVSC